MEASHLGPSLYLDIYLALSCHLLKMCLRLLKCCLKTSNVTHPSRTERMTEKLVCGTLQSTARSECGGLLSELGEALGKDRCATKGQSVEKFELSRHRQSLTGDQTGDTLDGATKKWRIVV